MAFYDLAELRRLKEGGVEEGSSDDATLTATWGPCRWVNGRGLTAPVTARMTEYSGPRIYWTEEDQQAWLAEQRASRSTTARRRQAAKQEVIAEEWESYGT